MLKFDAEQFFLFVCVLCYYSFLFSCSVNVQTQSNFFNFMSSNRLKLHLPFTVYGFQNNLAPTSSSVLTTSGANVHANVGGTTACSLT